jgi:rhodanese-related sulfurtransferase
MKRTALALALALAACGGATPTSSSPSSVAPTAKKIDGPTAHGLVASGARLVDVRSKDEYQAGHIDGAINVPVDDVAEHDFGAKDKTLIVYCGSGARSARAAQKLVEHGYTDVNDLGAMSNW